MAFGETRFNRHRGLTVAARPQQPRSGAQELAEAIVEHAIMDWRSLIKRKAWANGQGGRPNFGELRHFFTGDWCGLLLSGFPVTPERILALLEDELQEAMQNDEDAQRSKRKNEKRVTK